MQIKTYRGQSYSTLIKTIKTELGPDAVILSTDRLSVNGENSYEVVAAMENEPENNTKSSPSSDTLIPESERSAFDGEWRLEWENFKNSLFKIVKNHVSGPNITRRQKQILEYMEKQGVSSEVIMDLWSSMSENIHLPTMKVLDDIVPTHSLNKHLCKAKAHAFLGPSGAGKTTTVLRVALESRQYNPDWRICLVNTDTQHAGGRLYLKHYASLSGLNYIEAKTAADWKDLADRQSAYDLILIDTPGLDGQSGPITSEVEDLLDVQCHLVLSPVYGPSQLDHYLASIRRKCLKSLIWTKIDEACSYGALVNSSWKTGVPISYLSYGKSMKNCSSSATQENLWTLVFKKRLPENSGLLN